MQTIYLISDPTSTELTISATHATDEEGIKQLALKWYGARWEGDKCRTEINVDIEDKTVTIFDPATDDILIYDILIYDQRK